jgi:hypothetical protein
MSVLGMCRLLGESFCRDAAIPAIPGDIAAFA